MDEALKEKTKKTARCSFTPSRTAWDSRTGRRSTRTWRASSRMFFTGKLYSREVISQKQRELCAVASLTVLNREREVHAHIHAALNVGATRQEVAEVIFQQVTYGGMPVVVEALRCLPGGAGGAGRMGVTHPTVTAAPRGRTRRRRDRA